MAETYAARCQELRIRTRHPVRRRLLDALIAVKAPFSRITGLLSLCSALFAEAERRRNHGAVPIDFARRLYHRRTLDRYLAILLAQDDGGGGRDFYLIDGTLHIPFLRHSVEDMQRAEARWTRARLLARHRKARQRERERACPSAQPDHAETPLTGGFEAVCEMSRSDSSLREEDLRKDKDIRSSLKGDLSQLSRIEALWQAEEAETGAAHTHADGDQQPDQTRVLSSLEVTERAAAEERALRAADMAEMQRSRELESVAVPTPQARDSTVAQRLSEWGYDARRAHSHRFTAAELNRAVRKVERARTSLSNRAGAVVNAILRQRSGEWRAA